MTNRYRASALELSAIVQRITVMESHAQRPDTNLLRYALSVLLDMVEIAASERSHEPNRERYS